jgi:hypothetical protein
MKLLLKNIGLLIMVIGVGIIGYEQIKEIGSNELIVAGIGVSIIGIAVYIILNKIVEE